ncbi:hypothetical protein AA0498_1013 [Acidomonas methanolica]|uniref:Uncharacterized protein n=1 Tax=Acidomonas methanolica NBRC 104435 TaxID=1231351 RepID=A0A023D8L5_ACIMT|nr:hypothetical protein Amme_137_001 [Acidomonas methanolica NBRC 104435]GBQ49568.1 hypothetical protein AA0498_1013 [Acidomonas methanolica]GEK99238.1 hypothetical protein AME01nite_17370 [Acidomonas methanolica NBRC 104435]
MGDTDRVVFHIHRLDEIQRTGEDMLGICRRESADALLQETIFRSHADTAHFRDLTDFTLARADP